MPTNDQRIKYETLLEQYSRLHQRFMLMRQEARSLRAENASLLHRCLMAESLVSQRAKECNALVTAKAGLELLLQDLA